MPFIRDAKLQELMRAGSEMSNVMFNLKQSDELPQGYRGLFGSLQARWDDALRAVRGGRDA